MLFFNKNQSFETKNIKKHYFCNIAVSLAKNISTDEASIIHIVCCFIACRHFK